MCPPSQRYIDEQDSLGPSCSWRLHFGAEARQLYKKMSESVVDNVKCELEIQIGTCDRMSGVVAALGNG